MDIALSLYRKSNGWQDATPPDEDAIVACAEGDRLRLRVRAAEAPTVHMGGNDLLPARLGMVDGLVEAAYEFVIDSWAGRTSLSVDIGERRRRLILDVQPHPGKLGIEAFATMLSELSERSAALPWGMSPGQQGGRIAGPTAAAIFPAVLDALMPELLRHLRRFLRDPPIAVRRRRDLAPLSMARRPDTQTVRWLANHSRTLLALRPGERGTGERLAVLPSVEQPVTVTNHDHPVTRHLHFQLLRVRQMVDATARRFETLAGSGSWRIDPFVRGYAARVAEQCRRHRAALADALSAPAFRQSSPEPAREGALQALADLPAAAAVQRLAHRLLGAGLQLDAESALEASVKRTYDLYEAVVFYRLADAVQAALGPGWTARWSEPAGDAHEEKPHAAVEWQRDGQPTASVRLLYQQTFRAHSGKSDIWRSLSGELRPDYVIVFETDGDCRGWVILDAKYRASRAAVHDALRDLHVYRDALRHRDRRAKAAFIVVPALDQDASAYATADYVAEHAFGAVLSGADGDGLESCLRVHCSCVMGSQESAVEPSM